MCGTLRRRAWRRWVWLPASHGRRSGPVSRQRPGPAAIWQRATIFTYEVESSGSVAVQLLGYLSY
jgi:hypothetical protein